MRTALEFRFTVLLGSITYFMLLSVVRGTGINQFRPQPPCGLIAKSPKTLVSGLGKRFINFFLTCNLRHKKGGTFKERVSFRLLTQEIGNTVYQSLLVGGN